MTQFIDRTVAGRALAALLIRYRGREDVLVLGLPRGGVPVAAEVAEILEAPLDVMVVRKLRAPRQPEFAIGAIASGGVTVMNEAIAGMLEDSPQLRSEITYQRAELKRCESFYRNDRLPLDIRRRTVILVDDGAATGASLRAAVGAARKLRAARVVAAVPVAPADAIEILRDEADEVVCVLTPRFFSSVGEWYREFEQVADMEVCALLARAHALDHRKFSPIRSAQD